MRLRNGQKYIWKFNPEQHWYRIDENDWCGLNVWCPKRLTFEHLVLNWWHSLGKPGNLWDMELYWRKSVTGGGPWGFVALRICNPSLFPGYSPLPEYSYQSASCSLQLAFLAALRLLLHGALYPSGTIIKIISLPLHFCQVSYHRNKKVRHFISKKYSQNNCLSLKKKEIGFLPQNKHKNESQ